MAVEIDKLTVEELKNGYIYDIEGKAYICLTCKKTFEIGEVFTFENRIFEAFRAIKIHIESEHGDNFTQLLNSESKYNTFTDNQRELLSLIYLDHSDKEIAKSLGVSPSTIRHQRFMFREKAKQARMYLAIYEQAIEKKTSTEETINGKAHMGKELTIATEKESEHILNNAFECLSPLKLKTFPRKEKKKVVILAKIAEQMERGKRYSEKELNQILKDIYEDYVVIRRYLVDYGFMERTEDGKEYWLK